MLLATNYPQVPLATTNAATESLRVESQQRPAVVPPAQPTKSHEERAFNPQREPKTQDRAEAHFAPHKVRVDEREDKERSQEKGQERGQERRAPPAKARPLKIARLGAALKRSDLHTKAAFSDTTSDTTPPPGCRHPRLAVEITAELVQAIAAHVADFYQSSSMPAKVTTLNLTA